METELRKIAQTAYPERCEQVMNSALRVLENTFLFDAPWDMEQTHVPVVFQGETDWEYCPSGDLEWTFMLARHSFVLHLAQSYAMSGEARFAQKAEKLIADFLRRAPLTEQSKAASWRSLDAGIRISNWLDTWDILQSGGAAAQTLRALLEQGARLHADYLLSVDTPFCRLSNWGVIGNAGLYQAALFLDDRAAEEEAVRRLADEVSLQILPDGWQWEQSPMYHVEVMTALYRVVRLAARRGRTLPEIIPETARRMCRALAQGAKPNHRQFMQSDSDDTDLRDVITQGALLFRASELKGHGFPQPDFESLFWISPEQARDYVAMETGMLAHMVACASSGNYYLRTGWGEDDSCVHFHCGSLGGGHGHADLLHVDLCAFGRDVLVDSGRYTYVENDQRLWYRSCAAHNTFTVDGIPFTECAGSWDFGCTALPMPGAHYSQNGCALAEGGHLGYLSLPNPVVCRRMVVQLGRSMLFLLDICRTQGSHSYEQFFHFPVKEGLVLQGERAFYQAEDVGTAILYMGRDAEICITPYSKHYNQQEEKATLMLRDRTEGICVMPTAFVSARGAAPQASISELPVYNAKTQRQVSADSARAYRVAAQGETWELLFTMQDTVGENDLLTAGGICGHGRVIVRHVERQTVLAW